MIRLVPPGLLMFLVVAVVTAGAVRAADQPATAQSERRLPEWVGDDVGLCLELNELPRHWSNFFDSPLAKRLASFPPLAAWRERNRGLLAGVRGEIERRSGVPPKLLFTKLLGRQVLFAIWPPADAAAGKPSVLLLAEAADRELMQRTLKTLVAARKKAGKWRGERALEVAGETFTVDAVTPDDEQAEFFITSADRVAMIATSESLLRDVLARRADPAKASSLAASAAYRAAWEQLAPGAAARLLINPRAWDAALRSDLQRKPPGSPEAHSQKAVVRAWAATDYVAAALHVDQNLNAELAWQWRADDLPPGVREIAASLGGKSLLAGELPSDALLAFAAHADMRRLIRLLIAKQWHAKASSDKPSSDKKHGETVLAWALAAGIGPEVGGYLKAPPADAASDGARLPFDALFAVQTRSLEPGTGRPALVHQLEPLLHAWLSATAAANNQGRASDAASVETKKLGDDDGLMTVVSGIVPGHPQQQLVYRVDPQDRFWASTSADLLAAADPGRRLLSEPVMEAERRRGRDYSGVVYINLAGWRELAARGREAVDFLWADKQLDDRAREGKYHELQAIVRLADRVLLTSQIDSSGARLSLSLTADAP